MIPLSNFPQINASLNFLSAVLLTFGFVAIKNKKVLFHRICMGTAFLTSSLFLLCYLYYHAHAGSKPFLGQGLIRTVYFLILITHTILATAIVPLILRTLYLAVKSDFIRHARWARWTWPLWMYVSITGVVIYWMLYQ